MAQQAVVESPSLTTREIKEFAGASGPWITIFLPTDVPGGRKKSLSARLEKALQSAEEKLRDRQLTLEQIHRLTDAVKNAGPRLEEEAQQRSLVLFRSPDEMRTFWLPESLDSTVVVAENVYIRPFLKNIEGEMVFYILALSQKDVRLLRCNEHSSEEVDTKDYFTPNLSDYLAFKKPDHVLENRITAGPGVGAGTGVMFTTGTEAERKDEYLAHFFRQVNDGLVGLLRGQERTLVVLCGVQEALALYRRVNAWSNTPQEGVHGAPNGLKGGEMHARALDILKRTKERELEDILAQHDRQAGEIAQAGVNDIVRFAHEGRVLHLFVAEQANVLGHFDAGQFRSRAHQTDRPGDEDLINAAAVQTLLRGGRVHELPQARVPGNRPMACIARY
jgi:hypothetical protein